MRKIAGWTRESSSYGHDLFSTIGAPGFSELARHELAATGRRLEKRTKVLTKKQVAKCARETPAEIGRAHV